MALPAAQTFPECHAILADKVTAARSQTPNLTQQQFHVLYGSDHSYLIRIYTQITRTKIDKEIQHCDSSNDHKNEIAVKRARTTVCKHLTKEFTKPAPPLIIPAIDQDLIDIPFDTDFDTFEPDHFPSVFHSPQLTPPPLPSLPNFHHQNVNSHQPDALTNGVHNVATVDYESNVHSVNVHDDGHAVYVSSVIPSHDQAIQTDFPNEPLPGDSIINALYAQWVDGWTSSLPPMSSEAVAARHHSTNEPYIYDATNPLCLPTIFPVRPAPMHADWKYEFNERRSKDKQCAGCDAPFSNISIARKCLGGCKRHFCRMHIRSANQKCWPCHLKGMQEIGMPPPNRHSGMTCKSDYSQTEDVAFFEDFYGVPYFLSTKPEDTHFWTYPEVLTHRTLLTTKDFYHLDTDPQTLLLNWKGTDHEIRWTNHTLRGNGEALNCYKVSLQNVLDLTAYSNIKTVYYDTAWPYWHSLASHEKWKFYRNFSEVTPYKQVRDLNKPYNADVVSDPTNHQRRTLAPGRPMSTTFLHRAKTFGLTFLQPEYWFNHSEVYASTQRFAVNFGRTWAIDEGAKVETHASPREAWEWMTTVNYRKHLDNSELLLTIASKLEIMDEQQAMGYFSSRNHRGHYDKMKNNWIGYPAGGSMAPHRDVSIPNGKHGADGFDRSLIMIGTLECKPRKEEASLKEYGGKELSFLNRGKSTVSQHMSIATLPGDVLFLTPPATTDWFHSVPPVDCERSITMQWRKYLGVDPWYDLYHDYGVVRNHIVHGL